MRKMLVCLFGAVALVGIPATPVAATTIALFSSSAPGVAASPPAVPAGICAVTITAEGGRGGMYDGFTDVAGGAGAAVTARVAVEPGAVLNVLVGGVGGTGGGDDGSLTGDGGVGGGAGGGIGAAGGGGASVVWLSTPTALVVAGAGGGSNPAHPGGAGGLLGQPGGDGGTNGIGGVGPRSGKGGKADGTGGAGGGGSLDYAGGGGGGVGTGGAAGDNSPPTRDGGPGGTGNGVVGGAGGSGGGNGSNGTAGGIPPGAGSGGTSSFAGDGGAGVSPGGNAGTAPAQGSGGGGGGIGFGGGGGAGSGPAGGSAGGGAGYGAGGGASGDGGGGGGGGSSYVTPGALASSSAASALSGNGQVTITYDPVADACPDAPVACAPGFSSASGNAPCTAAPAGYYVDTSGATSATACSPGSYQPSSAQTSCLLASKGYYVDSVGATSQTACPSGSTTTVTGASECTLVNQAPSFTKGPDQTALANAAAQTAFPWATAISAGPASESGQRLDFIVSNDNPALFSVQPTVDVDGTLHFTPAANQTGVAGVNVQLRDDGGTANGGVDTSATQTFTITVNQAPSFAPDTSPPLTASVGQAYGYPFVATGYPATITYALVGAPAWLTIDANGVVGGTPPTGTTAFTYSVKATNAAGSATAGPYTVVVSAPPPASSKADVSTTLSCPASARINVNTTCTLTVRNAGPAVAKNVWVALALPSSLTRVSNTGTAVWWRNIATWKIASLNANATTSFTITFKARATGKATIGAATASTTPDPSWKNNITAASITLTR